MSRHADSLRLCLAQGPLSTRQLVEKTGLSQPTISRALAALGDEVLRMGAGPAIQYALRDRFRGFDEAPVFRVTEGGQIHLLGTLVPIRPEGFVMQQADGVSLHSEGLPWWLLDMRPQGYLGRAYASTYGAALGLPANPEHWSDSAVIRALLAHGQDATGNLLVGEMARERFLSAPEPQPVAREAAFPALALAAGTGDTAGSWAAGKQPKFCTFTENGHVLVKFSAPEDHPVSERWRDLLLAEHWALSVLGIETGVFDFQGQRFLEVPRFDRIGPLGRVGLFSLRTLGAEFLGDISSDWPVLVRRLADGGHVRREAVAQTARLWAFGTLIGNTDMHTGNLSFIGSDGRPYALAPAYDMLPMGFAPRGGGELVNRLRSAPLSAAIDGDTWREGLMLGERFFALLAHERRFSPGFQGCIGALRQHLDEAATAIARLG